MMWQKCVNKKGVLNKSLILLLNLGRGSRIRTLTNGFGDRHATITPILYHISFCIDATK